jgi:ADP-ribosyl-[dinitrogen reductase] hydrolase
MIEGSCLCGAVAFAIDGRVTPIQLCHARRCQKATGSAFAPELAAPAERFRWLRGEENVAHWEAPLLREPPPFRRSFCRSCGSPLPVLQPETGFVILLAGALDGDPGVRPFRHIFTSHAPAWDAVDDTLPSHPERPPPEGRLRARGGPPPASKRPDR